MNVYLYIAQSNPDAANEICKKYGYFEIENLDELSHCLQTIVAQNGESSLQEVLSLHPDKDVLLEIFDKKKDEPIAEAQIIAPTISDCSCNSSKMNAEGSVPSSTVNQTNTYIIVGALIVSFAILAMNKK
jgi:hypothetical protein